MATKHLLDKSLGERRVKEDGVVDERNHECKTSTRSDLGWEMRSAGNGVPASSKRATRSDRPAGSDV